MRTSSTTHVLRIVLGLAGLVVGLLAAAGSATAFWTVPTTTATAPTADIDALQAPFAASASALGSGAARVSWTLPATQAASASYVVTRTTGPGSPARVCSVSIDQSSCVDSSLAAGTAYSWTVAAELGGWRSGEAAAGAATPTPVLSMRTSSSALVAGAATAVEVTATLSGAVDTTYAGARTLVWGGLPTSPSGAAPAYPSSSAVFASGVASLSGLVPTAAGSGAVSVAEAGRPGTAGTLAVAVAPAAASRLAVLAASAAGPSSSTASIGPLVLGRQDAYGNAVTSGTTTVAVASTTAGAAVVSPTSGAAASAAVVIAAGSSSVPVWYGDTRAGAPVVTFSAPGLAGASQVMSVGASSLVVTSVPVSATVTSAATLGPVVVGLRDVAGFAVAAPASGVQIALSSSSSAASFAASSGGAPITSVTVPGGSSAASFWFSDTAAGTPALAAAAPGLQSASQAQTLSAGPAAALRLSGGTSGAASSSATIGPLTLTQTDAFANPVAANGSGLTVSLTTSSATGVIAASSAGSAITSVKIASGSSSATLWYGDTRAGSAALTAAATSRTSASQAMSVVAAAPARVTIASTPVTGAATSAASLGPVAVSLQDAFGNTAQAPNGGLPLTPTSSSGSSALFATSSGGPAVTTLVLPAGASGTSLWFGDTKTGTPTITIAATGLTAAAQAQTITAAPAARIVISTSPLSTTASAQAGAGPLTAVLQDAFGNTASAPSGGTRVGLASSSASAVFASSQNGAPATSITIAAGASSASAYYGDSAAGSPTITLTATGLAGAVQSATVAPAAATALVAVGTLSGDASSAAVLGPVSILLRDDFGNAVAATSAVSVALTSSSTGTKVFAATSGGAAVTAITIPAGSSSATFWYGDTRAGTPTITASATGRTSATVTASVAPGSVSRVAFTSSGLALVAASGATAGPATVQLQDAFGNAVPAGGSGTAIALTSSSAAGVFAASSGGAGITSVLIPAGSTSASFWYGDTRAGSPTLTASAPGASSATQAAAVSAGAAAAVAVTSAATSSTASSSALAGPITVTQTDAFGNAVKATSGGLAVALGSSSTGIALFAATSGGAAVTTVTIPSGSSSATFWYGDTKAGAPVITVSAGGRTNGQQAQTVTAAAPYRYVFTTSPLSGKSASQPAIGPLGIALKDAFGNDATAAGALTVSLSSSSATGIFSTTSRGASVTSLTVAAGQGTASFYYGDTRVGVWTLTVGGTLVQATQSVTTT